MKVLMSALVLVLVVLQYKLWLGEGSVTELREIEAQVDVQKQENLTLAERNQVLEGEVLDLKTVLDAVEERARSEFGMVKQGETLFIVVD
jgi:cell division protein FtsB